MRHLHSRPGLEISTDHDSVDYRLLAKARLVVDTRNAMASRGFGGCNVVKA